MRILIAHSRYLSGPASGENRVVEDEARLLADAGHEVQVWDPLPATDGPLARVRAGVDAVWSARATSQIRRRVAGGGVDVLHCHNLFPTLSPAVLRVAARAGVPVVVTLHNYRLMCLPATLLRDGRICEDCVGRVPWPGVVHRCYRGSALGSGALAASLALHRSIGSFDLVTLFLAVGGFVRDKHVEAGVPSDRIQVKANFAWPVARRSAGGRYSIFVGRLAREKGVETILDAWRDAPGELLIAGDGPDAERLRRLAPPRVRFLGSVPSDEVPSLIREARALLVPSLWYEGQPRAVLEAYAAAVPVVASRIGGLAELVTDGRSGLLVDAGDPGSWAVAVKRISDDAECDRLGEGAYAEWTDRYTPERGLRALEEAYATALDRAGG
ncbi:MAG TPA: glycosyltransferase [Actinomycetota bacterium]